MEKKPARKFRFRRIALILLLLCVVFFTIILLPATQTFLGNRIAARVADNFGTHVTLGTVQVSPFGSAIFRDVLAIDHQQDTLIYIGYLRLSALKLRAFLQGNNDLGDVMLQDVSCNIITYKDEEKSNINQFFARFSKNNEEQNPRTNVKLSSIRLTNAKLQLHNQNKAESKPLNFTSLNAAIEHFKVVDDHVSATIDQIDAHSPLKNIKITSLSGDYSYTPTSMQLSAASLQTTKSFVSFNADLRYPVHGLSAFADSVFFDLDLSASKFGKDLISFLPIAAPFDESNLKGNISGSLQHLHVDDLSLAVGNNKLEFSGVSKDLLRKNRTISGNWSLVIDKSNQIIPSDINPKTSAFISRLGSLKSNGTATLAKQLWQIDMNINADLGDLATNMTIDTRATNFTYKVQLQSAHIDLGTMIDVPTLGTTGLNMTLTGTGLDLDNLTASAKGSLTDFYYRDYSYDVIALEGFVNPQLFNGNLQINDQAARLNLSGKINFDAVRNFSFTSDIKHMDLAVFGLTNKDKNSIFSGSIDLALQGNSLDEMIGDLYIENGRLQSAVDSFRFSSLALQSRLNEAVRVINVSSDDVVSGVMIGYFKPTEFFKLIQNAAGAQYPHYQPYKITPNQYVDFNFNLRNKLATAFFGNQVSLDNNTFIKGSINSKEQLFSLDVRIPKAVIKNNTLDNLSFTLDAAKPEEYSNLSIEKIVHERGEVNNLHLATRLVDDTLLGDMSFDMSKSKTGTSQVQTTFTFDKESHAVLEIEQANFVFDQNRWQLQRQNEAPKLKFINLTNFSLSEVKLANEDAAISLKAAQQGNESFSLNMGFNKVKIDEVLSFKKNYWQGVVNGFLNIEQTPKGIEGSSNVAIHNLELNDTRLGDATVTLQSEQGATAYQLAFRLEDEGEDVVSASGKIGVLQQKPQVDVSVSFVDYNLSLLAGLTTNVFNPFYGNANGDIRLQTVDDVLVANGVLNVDDLSLSVPYLNTHYHFTETVPFIFDASQVTIDAAPFVAYEKSQQGVLHGNFSHNSFDTWRLDMQIDANNLNVLDTDFTQTALYYGDAHFTGNAHLYGPFTNMQIDVTGKTAQGTNMFIPIQYDTAIGDVSYINFVEKKEIAQSNEQINTNVRGLQLRFDLDVTPDAQVEIVVDPETKSYLRGTGAGNLLLEIDTAGSFAMWGDFIALDGIYNFKNFGLIDKKFTLEPGGTIVWEGDPFGAQVNMRAVYDVPGGANPAILLEGDNVSQKIPTEVTINLFGNLLNPETPTFEIDFPNTSGVVKNELNYRLNDQERRQLQAISLLSQGSFINEVSLAAISSQTLTNNLFQKASGVFDNIFTNEHDQLNLSLNYLQGDRNAAVSIKNRDRLGLSLSTNINERILIDGKVGVPVGSEDETMIIGNVTLEFLLNPQGNLRARIFNKENEFQYFGDELGYTQGVGVAYQVRFNSFNELVRKIFNKK